MTETPIRRILFPTDLSDCAEGAFSHAAFLAERFGASLHVLHVREHPGFPPPDWTDALRITPEDIANDLGLPLAPEADAVDLVEMEHLETEASDVAAAILHQAAALDADLIVMGTHGRSGIERAVLGSVAESVVRHARCPVFTVRPTGDRASGGGWALRRVLVAVETASPPPPQVAWAASLARAYGARVDLLHTVPISLLTPGSTAAARTARHELRALEDTLLASGVRDVVSRVVEGDPADAIVDTARVLGVDLVVVGSHGREGVRRALLGSVSERVIRSAPSPVFVARTARVASTPLAV
ncbi:MAG: universal stress protein [Bacteroidota bacterium]